MYEGTNEMDAEAPAKPTAGAGHAAWRDANGGVCGGKRNQRVAIGYI